MHYLTYNVYVDMYVYVCTYPEIQNFPSKSIRLKIIEICKNYFNKKLNNETSD